MAGIIKKTQLWVEEVQVEMRRVTWPDREQLRNATIVILIFVMILALIIGIMDTAFSWLVRTIVGLFGG
ncbi:MAG: preprotein translocase subunit SecE [Gemmatimonadetes bacterium]|nr:preprotein translocase subunit SecE [Gemmatimonadota bacterium]